MRDESPWNLPLSFPPRKGSRITAGEDILKMSYKAKVRKVNLLTLSQDWERNGVRVGSPDYSLFSLIPAFSPEGSRNRQWEVKTGKMLFEQREEIFAVLVDRFR